MIERLGYEPPFAGSTLLEFFRARALPGLEAVTESTYRRAYRVGDTLGWFEVEDEPESRAVTLRVSESLRPHLDTIVPRVRRLLDLDAPATEIDAHLATFAEFRASVDGTPGVRVPGSVDDFEPVWRAVLGQQISVRAASATAGRLVGAFGTRGDFGPGLEVVTPTPDQLADVAPSELRSLGVPTRSAATITTVARALVEGALDLSDRSNPTATIAKLVTYPGIGPWTAHYVAMRVLRWSDAFLERDRVVQRNLPQLSSPAEIRDLAEPWRPWRAYAVLRLWNLGG